MPTPKRPTPGLPKMGATGSKLKPKQPINTGRQKPVHGGNPYAPKPGGKKTVGTGKPMMGVGKPMKKSPVKVNLLGAKPMRKAK